MNRKIGTISEIKSKLDENHLKIKKKLGQNFLADQNIINQIIQQSRITKDSCVIEIGPGLGSLTEHLIQSAKKVVALEIDSDLIPVLRKSFPQDHFVLFHQDVLETDIDELISAEFPNEEEIVVVANLPYYITTPILMRFLEKSKRVSKLILMVQLEVAKRFTSPPKSKDYNALSVVIQYRSEAKLLFRVPRTVFIPEPNVDSAVIEILIRSTPSVEVTDEVQFFEFIHQCFSQKRKTLINNLNSYLKIDKPELEKILISNGYSSTVRAEELSIDDFKKLFNIFFNSSNDLQ